MGYIQLRVKDMNTGTNQIIVHNGFGSVYLSYALAREYPSATREWIWKYVFPARKLSVDPRSGKVRRYH